MYLPLSNIRTRRYKQNTWAWAGSSDPHGTQHCGTSDPSLAHMLSCVWLCDSVDCSPPGSSAHGIFQARILEWIAIFFSRGSSSHRDWTHVLASPTLTGRFFTHWVIGKASNREQPLIKRTNCTITGRLSSLNSFYSGRINCSFSHPTGMDIYLGMSLLSYPLDLSQHYCPRAYRGFDWVWVTSRSWW